jgi:hypothetical protein
VNGRGWVVWENMAGNWHREPGAGKLGTCVVDDKSMRLWGFRRRGSDWSSNVDSYARAPILRLQAKANVQAETDGVHQVMGLAWGVQTNHLARAMVAG